MMMVIWTSTYSRVASMAVWELTDICGSAWNVSAVSRLSDALCVMPFASSCFVVEIQVPFFHQRRMIC